MKYSVSVILFTAFFAQTLGQTLVMLGGNLRDDNTVVWQKIVQSAVSAFNIIFIICCNAFNIVMLLCFISIIHIELIYIEKIRCLIFLNNSL